MSVRISEYLVDVPIFADLDDRERVAIEKFMFFNRIVAGDFVFREGDKGDFVCFVASGVLEVTKTNHQGQVVVIATLGKGSSLGEMSLIDKLTRSASVRARTAVSLVVLTRKGFDMVLKMHPDMGIKILRGIASLLSINLRKTSERLAEFMPPLA